MSTQTVRRAARSEGPAVEERQLDLAEPPVMPEATSMDAATLMGLLPMLLGGLMMGVVFVLPGAGTTTYLMSGVMGSSMMIMGLTQLGRGGTDRKKKLRSERRDYLRYLAQMRRQAGASADEQRSAARWDNPPPAALWTLVDTSRVWERRTSHSDFARVRIGLGARRAALEFAPPRSKPVEDLEPLSAISLRRFIRTHQRVSGLPIAVGLRRFTTVEFSGDADDALHLVRAVLASLATLHSPDELRVAVLCDDAALPEWDWVKWLPHAAHHGLADDAGALRLVATDHDELLRLLGPEFAARSEHDTEAVPSADEPFVVVVAHRSRIPASSRLVSSGVRNAVVLDVTGAMTGGPKVLRLHVEGDVLRYPVGDGEGTAVPDRLGIEAVTTLARRLAPLRTSAAFEVSDKPLEHDLQLTSLIGIRNAITYDVAAKWRGRIPQNERLRAPIGITEDGEIVELDLKESAQGGMGPHGLLIGATGSGKSELLRTLILSLTATHSSETLNLVLVDFKGGATFLGMERLPHTSAVITNLAGELELVDRMQDALNGEIMRRQELLHATGFASLFDYEKARLGGQLLEPLPSLVVVVDEFSELLASKPDFVELFVTIGRVGRSLGLHMLLASQRVDEGRISRVEGHLSYRIALKTFSSMESRSVIGTSDAYELPSAPGNGYLKFDTTTLLRFKAAYVSGPYAPADGGSGGDGAWHRDEPVVPFGLAQDVDASVAAAELAARERAEADAVPEADDDDDTLVEVLLGRLEGAGAAARQVWLPPLTEPATLDQLLPAVEPLPGRGMATATRTRLTVPLGIVDRPFEQARDLLVVDLNGARGHAAVVSGPQLGKSTALRSLILALALTHTPEEVQFHLLDFGGGGLASIAGLPHVGSIATRLDRDLVTRTVLQVHELFGRREKAFSEHGCESFESYRQLRDRGVVDDRYGDVFLVVDGWGSIRGDYEDLEERLGELAARGLSYGIHLLVTAVRWSEINMRVRDLFGTKIELRLGDPLESEIGSRQAKTVPERPGRGITHEGKHFLTALPRLDGDPSTTTVTASTRRTVDEVAAFWPGEGAPPVHLLAEDIPVTSLPDPTGDLRVCVGVDEAGLEPAWHDFDRHPHLMVFGDQQTGKSNLLKLMARAIVQRYTPAQARIIVADPTRGLHDHVPAEYRAGYAVDTDTFTELAGSASVTMEARLPSADLDPRALRARDWWTGAQLFVLVDDHDLLAGDAFSGGPMAPLVPMLHQAEHIGLRLVLARSTSGAMRAMNDPVIRRLWEIGAPAYVLSYPREEGSFIGSVKPRTLPPGRAQFATRRSVGLVQLARADGDDLATHPTETRSAS